MAEKSTKVRRIKATEAEVVKKPKSTAKAKKVSAAKEKIGIKTKIKGFFGKFHAPKWLKVIGKPFAPAGRYIAGSYQELRQTKWPNRKSTWKLTLAVIIFSVFFAALILAFDALFDFIIKEVIL